MTDIGLPPKFWQTLSDVELKQVFASGELDRTLCRRLWHMMDYQGKPPTRARILVSKADVERLIKEIKAR